MHRFRFSPESVDHPSAAFLTSAGSFPQYHICRPYHMEHYRQICLGGYIGHGGEYFRLKSDRHAGSAVEAALPYCCYIPAQSRPLYDRSPHSPVAYDRERMDTEGNIRMIGRSREVRQTAAHIQQGEGRNRTAAVGMSIDKKFRRIHGTGSYPLPPHGWQRSTRLRASQSPLPGPYFLNASTAYCEQVGVKRQEGGVNGEIYFW